LLGTLATGGSFLIVDVRPGELREAIAGDASRGGGIVARGRLVGLVSAATAGGADLDFEPTLFIIFE